MVRTPGQSTIDPGLTADLLRVANEKIFFGHQSVGDDIVLGLREIARNEAHLNLTIVNSAHPESVSGPAFVESHIGENGNPQSKADAFRTILDQGLGGQGAIALYKYCYVDIDASTDIAAFFDRYRNGIDAVKLKYPLIKIVHVTIPLTTVESGVQACVKRALGRTTARAINWKRNEYNRLLMRTYAGTDPVFDLAAVESMGHDGSRSSFACGHDTVLALNPDFTTDGGHLNHAGRRAAANALIRTLVKASPMASVRLQTPKMRDPIHGIKHRISANSSTQLSLHPVSQ